MPKSQDTRIAFLFPSLARGAYWQPVLAEFTKQFPNTLVLTGIWEGYLPSYRGGFWVEVVGQTRFVQLPSVGYQGHYPRGFVWAPIRGVIQRLWNFRPNVVFSSGFSIWTLIARILKKYGGWRLVIVYDGSSPSVDRIDSRTTLAWRRFLANGSDAFVSNTRAGKEYLRKFLNVSSSKVFVHPYEVPDPKLWRYEPKKRPERERRVVFITVGRLIEQKGLPHLIEAVRILWKQVSGNKFAVLIVGEGPLRVELEEVAKKCGLSDVVKFVGHVEYEGLGYILQTVDVFIFPTLEDVWGMAPLEAMSMGLPVLCSRYAGASELIEDGITGWIFDPYSPETMAELMKTFVDQPSLAERMGAAARAKMFKFTPKEAADFLSDVVKWVTENRK